MISLCLVSIKLFLVRTILCATVQTYTAYTTITTRSLFCLPTTFLQATLVRYSSHTTIPYSVHTLCVSTNTYSLDVYSEELLTTTFSLHGTHLHTRLKTRHDQWDQGS